VTTFVTQALNTLSLVLILSLVALGLAVIFGVMGIVNLAHGEFFMLGAFAMVATIDLDGSFWVGLIVAPLAVAALGLVIEGSLIRFLYKRPIESLLATWGLSIVLRQVVEIGAGKGFQNVQNPLPGAASLFGVPYPEYRLFTMSVAVVLLAMVFWVVAKTDVGMYVRAAMDNPEMASALGLNTRLLYRSTFALGAALAAFAGALMSPLISVVPNMGLTYVVDAFLVVIVGGLNSLVGVLAGGATIGGVQGVAQYATDNVGARVIVLALAIVMIRLRPSGLVR
jgi:urea transport system permease protein